MKIEKRTISKYDGTKGFEYGYYDKEKYFHLHREDDLPAFVKPDTIGWSYHGVVSRKDRKPVFYIKYGNSKMAKWQGQYYDEKIGFHRDDGPAKIDFENNDIFDWYINDDLSVPKPTTELVPFRYHYFINHVDITREVVDWMQENNIPKDYTKWTESHKMLFKLTFS